MLFRSVMVELAKRGTGRQQAHEILRRCSTTALEEDRELAKVLADEEIVARHLSPEEIKELLDPHRYIGTAVEQVERLEDRLRPLLD